MLLSDRCWVTLNLLRFGIDAIWIELSTVNRTKGCQISGALTTLFGLQRNLTDCSACTSHYCRDLMELNHVAKVDRHCRNVGGFCIR